ncbi:MAG: PD40 domain-containing protein [Phycisphaeraceae bacterium]|nr:MAG: PD40 domain-containing protein [Phycisphaeraceae bacterium]
MITLLALAASAIAQPQQATPAQPPLDWRTLEAPLLTNHRQLTSRDDFVRAGESYFSPDAKAIVFQAVPAPRGTAEPDPFFAMFVATFDGQGLGPSLRVSPPGSANTCGWFHPSDPSTVLFASTITPPADPEPSGYQRGTSRYRWAFPREMELVTRRIPEGWREASSPAGGIPAVGDLFKPPVPIFERPNYDAECSYDPTGRFVLYAHIKDTPPDHDHATLGPPKPDADIAVFDTKTGKDYPLVVAPGYDGGPFFSPCGQWITYRSDRRGNDELQIFLAKLAFTTADDGARVPTGIELEFQITDNPHVNWCPFFHPAGDTIVYASSQAGHHNYEVFAIKIDLPALAARATPGAASTVIADLPQRRITHADGADVLPAFSPDGRLMIWCAQRGPKADADLRPSSQVWVADWNHDALWPDAAPLQP